MTHSPLLLAISLVLVGHHLSFGAINYNPTLLIEGCIDDGCLSLLSQKFGTISKCFDPLREQIPSDAEDYSVKLCCNVAQYEKCIFPYIISICGMDSLDKFESELRSLNSMCSMTTLQWAKCEVAKNTTQDLESELRE